MGHFNTRFKRSTVATVIALAMLTGACGGGDGGPAACEVGPSEFGPLVEQMEMTPEAATVFMEEKEIGSWIRVDGSGDWGDLWAFAEDELGTGIHTDLSWIELDVRIDNLDGQGASIEMPVTVSRSYQGKIEETKYAEYEALAVGSEANFDTASCQVVRVVFADPDHEEWLDLSDRIEIANA